VFRIFHVITSRNLVYLYSVSFGIFNIGFVKSSAYSFNIILHGILIKFINIQFNISAESYLIIHIFLYILRISQAVKYIYPIGIIAGNLYLNFSCIAIISRRYQYILPRNFFICGYSYGGLSILIVQIQITVYHFYIFRIIQIQRNGPCFLSVKYQLLVRIIYVLSKFT